MRSIFICYTPYHFLLSYMFKHRRDNDLIIIVDQYGKLDFWDSATSISKNIKFIKHQIARSPLLFAKQLSKIKKEYPAVTKVYLFNDKAAHSWITLNIFRARATFYIEDGSSAYSNSKVVSSHIKKALLSIASKIPIIKYEYVEVLGTSKEISGGYYLFPQNVRFEHKEKPVLQYEKDDQRLDDLKKFFLANDTNPSEPYESEILALAPSSKGKVFLDQFKRITEKIAAEKDLPLVIKEHPLDQNKATTTTNQKTLPKQYPAEALVITGKSKVVIGNFTTTLHAAKFLSEDCIIINISTKKGKESNIELYRFLSSINVQQIDAEAN
ncbi:MAG: glycosyltransferase family 52 [Burkholderiaceae bacterium]|nr:glycosyltransferase family 52 [Burkholderiaceae bacterium]